VPLPTPPLGLLFLGTPADPQRSFRFGPNEQLLLYTDGVTEARDAKRMFYPLHERVGVLAAKMAGRGPVRSAANGGTDLAQRPDLLDLIRADLLRHTGAPLGDDAALLLVRAPAAWPGRRLLGMPPAQAGTIVG
jgi:hypothetical protein